MNILITGKPGVGKTTLMKEIVRNLAVKSNGFYTEEIRKEGQRTSFKIKTLDGKTGILASVDVDSPYKVGKYRVNLEDFERVALPAIEEGLKTSCIIIIDEIGPMELYSKKFKDLVLKTLDSQNPVIATIKEKGSKFVSNLKSRSDVRVYTLTRDNHVEILEKIVTAC